MVTIENVRKRQEKGEISPATWVRSEALSDLCLICKVKGYLLKYVLKYKDPVIKGWKSLRSSVHVGETQQIPEGLVVFRSITV